MFLSADRSGLDPREMTNVRPNQHSGGGSFDPAVYRFKIKMAVPKVNLQSTPQKTVWTWMFKEEQQSPQKVFLQLEYVFSSSNEIREEGRESVLLWLPAVILINERP